MPTDQPNPPKCCIFTTHLSLSKNALIDCSNAVVLCFEDFDEALTVATPCRLALLKIIREKKPESLYELAIMAEKNQAYVYRESKILKELGLIDFEQSNEIGRKKMRPISLFDEIVLWF